ncbi:FAD-dependent monooxygenase [Actinomadura sp. NPDC047616]|uniref:FAD-dependent monooxygenase n=1 Tax=Actinomadura sp. NPDC047616 TaxID=3155914 RepID=UPI003402D6B4
MTPAEPPHRIAVVGAGPTGLALAAELALAGVPVRLYERRPAPRTDSRAIVLHARSLELLDLRGLAGRFTDQGRPLRTFPLGVRGAAVDFGRLPSDFPYMLSIPQSRVEALLVDRVRELGAEFAWSSKVAGLEQNGDEVRVELDSGERESFAYVVGCDGIRSFTRESLGLPFPGHPNPGSVALADLYLDGLSMDTAYGELSDRGMLLAFPFRDGSCRLVLYDYARADAPVDEPVTLPEVHAGIVRITGRDLGPRDMTWSGRYRSESRQVTAYRHGRVLLAGDAAHTHSPAGAQGLNAGLQDAFNLGWKLAAAVAGRAPGWLLDSYHDERHPVGAAVLALTGRQFRLNTARTPLRKALRWTAERLVAPLPPVAGRLARAYSGVSVAYPPRGDGAHRLAGTRLPPGTLAHTGGSATRLYEHFHRGRFVLFDTAGHPALPGHVTAVRHSGVNGARLPAATLVRPDGYIAWASDERDEAARVTAAAAAVREWCPSR